MLYTAVSNAGLGGQLCSCLHWEGRVVKRGEVTGRVRREPSWALEDLIPSPNNKEEQRIQFVMTMEYAKGNGRDN